MAPTDLLTSASAFLMTVMILSYLVGDNPAFRIAVHVFVGVAAGYVASVAWWQVLLPNMILPLLTGSSSSRVLLALPLLLSGLLLMKAWPPFTRLGSPPLGMLVGAAAAVAIGGAIQGTIVPQTAATLELLGPDTVGSIEHLLNGILVVVGVVATLAYFQFSAGIRKDGSVRRPVAVEVVAAIGGVFLAVSLGVLFAGAYSAALTAFIERLSFLGGMLGLS
jgi:hypothetical protein